MPTLPSLQLLCPSTVSVRFLSSQSFPVEPWAGFCAQSLSLAVGMEYLESAELLQNSCGETAPGACFWSLFQAFGDLFSLPCTAEAKQELKCQD